MATTSTTDRSTEPKATDFYLPATSISSALAGVESFLEKHLGRHGVVLIPDTYNK